MARGESNFQAQAIKFLVSQGAYTCKVHVSEYVTPDTPDLLICYRGLFLALELKDPKFKDPWKHVSDDQFDELLKVIEAGGYADVANNLQHVVNWLCYLDAIAK